LARPQVISGENWNDNVANYVDAVGWMGAVYTLVVFCIGNTLFVNLFTSVLIDTFITTKREKKREMQAQG
jgi:hypothetical protein